MSKQPGSARDTEDSASASTFLSTLVPVVLISSAILGVFLIFRSKLRRVYEPRTYHQVLDKEETTPQPARSKFGWISDYRSIRDDYVLNHSSLDNYLFLRLFKIIFVICLGGAIITWPVLWPVYATGGAGKKQFDMLSMSNVVNVNRYYATVLIAWIFLTFVILVITRETILFINLRQSVLLSPAFKTRLSTKTVLFTTVPEQFRNEASIRELFTGVRRVWVQPAIKELTDLVKKRDKAATKLETAENKMCINLVKNRKKAEKKGKSDDIPLVDNERNHIEINKKDRPTHKLKFLIGKKVDTIDWARPEIQSLTEQINTTATKVNQADKVPALFVEFDSLEASQAAFRQIASQGMRKRELTPRALSVQPEDIIWKNLGNTQAKNKIILAGATTFVTVMIIFWAIPVTFVGVISNINTLKSISFLTWLNSVPSVILGVITGLLPAVLLAVLMALVPIVLRLLAGLFEPTRSAVELKTQSWYFAFQVVDVFLVTTFASGAASVGKQIADDPSSAVTLLAQNLPLASNFYTAYFVITMLQQAAMTVLNAGPLVFALVLGKILDKTPRKVYNRYTNLIGLGWGSVYPSYTMLGCIAIAYSCVAPLLLGFAAVGFGCLYLAYRYQLLYVIGNQSIDMKGRSYARALQQLFIGIYLSEFCLVGLFAINTGSSAAAAGPLVLMIIFTVFTVVYQVIMRKTLGPLINGLELVPGTEGDSHVTKNHSIAETEEGSNSKDHLSPSATPAAPVGGIRGKLLKLFFHTPLAQKYAYPKHPLAAAYDMPVRNYTEQEYDEAFLPPAITSRLQTIWIARDQYGLSHQEVAGCEQFDIPASDAEATLDEKAKVHWNSDRLTEAPIYEERVPY